VCFVNVDVILPGELMRIQRHSMLLARRYVITAGLSSKCKCKAHIGLAILFGH
jgi:hypothetical protein